jgi:hypothetical protein
MVTNNIETDIENPIGTSTRVPPADSSEGTETSVEVADETPIGTATRVPERGS